MKKLLIICGQTATGKTNLAVILAKKFHGEIISADSRQVYRGMDVGTGKDIDINSKLNINTNRLAVGYRIKNGIPVWLVDIVDPDYVFNAGEYQKLAREVINDIWSRNKLPIVAGGTGLYIKSLIEPLTLMQVPPNPKLRQKLDCQTREQLAQYLQKINPEKWQSMNRSDRLNPRRLIRAIETSKYLKDHRVPMFSEEDSPNDIFIIGLETDNKTLYQMIDRRVEERVKMGMKKEIKLLLNSGYSWENSALGTTIGYKQWQKHLDGSKTIDEITKEWQFAEHGYARRQMVWFRRQKYINWFDITNKDYILKIEKTVRKWYTSKEYLIPALLTSND